MDFTRQSVHTPQATRPVNVGTDNNEKHKPKVKAASSKKWIAYSSVGLLFTSTVLIGAVILLLLFGHFSGYSQAKFVDTSKYQAVFLNDNSSNGQSVYFGHITQMTSSYLVLQNVYYITNPSSGAASSTTSAANYQLTKLGCQQLHDPSDQMVINISQVAFWENLQDSGKVVQTIKQFQKDNPNGPDCSQTSNTTTSSGSTQTTGNTGATTSTNTGSTSTTTPTTSTTPSTSTTNNSTTSTTKP